ncbi:unnamed protein product [Rotaria sp. Silwood1]|nr:unnamed protein product [Rotaria sp. Silwood1]CAF1581091.1 unnamed protein product [Rotaria sp. Silwood1]CAF1582106.1 unnamed protein product [Rotaria sp. Silwood1]CAF3724906.1 unnamed protein product [Rotaria sp. Silwood1]CAF3763540.1 unnamed protein product [Rotaria sp. Silwood1]
MYLIYICIIIVLIPISTNHALPNPSSFYFDDDQLLPITYLHMKRQEVFDPYGFNTILTRFSKRNKLDDTYTKETNGSFD